MSRGATDGGLLSAKRALADGGEMGALVQGFDWASTSLGGPDTWPQSLKTAVRIMLTSRYAMWIGCGRDLVFLYNDAYGRMTLGGKHPWALGRPAPEVWAEIWPDIGPRIQTVMDTGTATWDEALLLFLQRSGYPEETYHTFSYSPLPGDDGRVAGMLCVVTEETERIIGERRLASLRVLASELASTTREEAVLAGIGRAVGGNRKDLPFTLTYLFEDNARRARLACSTGIEAGHPAAPPVIEAAATDAVWPAAALLAAADPVMVDDLAERFGGLPTGAWDVPPRRAVVVPIAQQGQGRPAGFLVAAVNPYRQFDAPYAGFVDLVAGQIASGLANARAYGAEKRRAEALAELDRAKTAFFSNVSHEFRTPLTLMLGPAEDALADRETPPANRERVELIYRNALRLLKLVNTLLDFSRIEAGRLQAVYEPTDLAAYTAELASAFRSAMQRAGLAFVVDCPPLPAPVYVDRDLWEKVVLNLLSNALKFTFEGRVAVRLTADDGGRTARLSVADTGTGIPPEELPRLFERFHRIRGARARTQEGTGIGLALVHELVKLHGGTVEVASTLGVGTTFTVSIPAGRAHLPSDRIGASRAEESTALGAVPFVEEALRWLPDAARVGGADGAPERWADQGPGPLRSGPTGRDRAAPAATGAARILLADDNADMRDYLRRLLSTRWTVDAVADGTAALAAARARVPDLVLADVMMPGLDGFELLRELRADPRTLAVPVVLLSARAGEESKVEGLEAGADDYLVKPFSARELLARIGAHLELTRVRAEAARREQELNAQLATANAVLRESEQRLRAIVGQVTAGIAQTDLTGRFVLVNQRYCEILGRPMEEVLGLRMQDVTHPDDLPRNVTLFGRLADGGPPFVIEKRYVRPDGSHVWVSSNVSLVRDGSGRPEYAVAVVLDMTDRRRAEEALQDSEERYRLAARAANDVIWDWNMATGEVVWSGALRTVFGYEPEAAGSRIEDAWRWWSERIHPEDRDRAVAGLQASIDGGQETWTSEYRFRRADGAYAAVIDRGYTARRDDRGKAVRMVGSMMDITERKQGETEREELLIREQAARADAEAAVRAREAFLARASHELRTPLTSVRGTVQLLKRALEGRLAEPPQDLVALADRSVNTMLELVNSLLDASKLAAGGDAVALEEVGLAELVQRSVELVAVQGRDKGVALSTAVPGELRLRVDRLKLEQVLVNLLGNAITCTPGGGEVTIEVRTEGARALIRVRDTGEGIAPEHLERIFEPFFQAERRGQPRRRGTGLGLAICRQIVALHGGQIWAESEGPGKGSTFTVRLPVHPAGSRAA